MSMSPETDRASTWVALVMVGFMGVSVLVWVLTRASGDAPAAEETPAGVSAATATAAAVQQKEQKAEASKPAQPSALAPAAASPNERPQDVSLSASQPIQTNPRPAEQKTLAQSKTSDVAPPSMSVAARAEAPVVAHVAPQNAAPLRPPRRPRRRSDRRAQTQAPAGAWRWRAASEQGAQGIRLRQWRVEVDTLTVSGATLDARGRRRLARRPEDAPS